MKVLFFLFAVGTCQVTWKGKSGKWLVILADYSGFKVKVEGYYGVYYEI